MVLRALIDQMYKSKVLPDQFQAHISALLGTFGQPGTPSPTNVDLPRPTKRRRMDRIPAGAEDWIVPYPFQPDEVPEHFQEMRDIHILDSVLKSLERNVKSWKNARGVLNEPTRPRGLPSNNDPTPASLSMTLNESTLLNETWLHQPDDELLLALDRMLGVPAHQPTEIQVEDPTIFASGLLESLGLTLPSVTESTASTSRLTTPVDPEFGLDSFVFDGMDWSALENPAGPKNPNTLPNDLPMFLDGLGSTSRASMVASPSSLSSRSTTPMMDSSHPVRLVPALSKRGRGRSTAVLRRQFSHKVPSSSPVPSVEAEPISARGTRKTRASQETTKKRDETLARAREYREALAMELERARTERWEMMMEGVVLREARVLIVDMRIWDLFFLLREISETIWPFEV